MHCNGAKRLADIGRHDACNDRNVTRAIFDEVRSKRAERLLQEWTRSNRSRNLTQYLMYAAPTQSHTSRKIAEFKLTANWTNEGRSAGGSLSPDLMITATRRETRSMTAHAGSQVASKRDGQRCELVRLLY
jgi:hypothetical protein